VILPLGASITYGSGSSDGTGYRQPLFKHLTTSGSKVSFIGSVRAGNMTDNHVEGHPGATIAQTINYAKLSMHDHPNLILIHVGTNDVDVSKPLNPFATAPDRLGALLDELISAAPSAAILVSQLIHATNAVIDARIQTFNAAVPAVVQKRVDAGHRVVDVAAMGTLKGNLNPDGIHPTDEGYRQMADVWFEAIREADRLGWVTTAV
jgi:lysophospholipase L1-like esterase